MGSKSKPVGHNFICILALNMVIDKIYLVLWYWYILVAILGTIRIICRLFQMSSGNIRYWLMKIKMHRYVFFYIDGISQTRIQKKDPKGIRKGIQKEIQVGIQKAIQMEIQNGI